jgi:hypothetical protein
MGFVSQIWSDRVVLEESQDNLSKDGKSFDEIVVWLENIQIFFPKLKYFKCSFENKHKNIRKEIFFSHGCTGWAKNLFQFHYLNKKTEIWILISCITMRQTWKYVFGPAPLKKVVL